MSGEASGHNHARREGPGFVARLAITLLLVPLLLVLLKPALMRFVQSRTASYAGIGHFDDAVRVSKKWLMFDGGNPVAWSGIAAYYRSAGQGEEALRAYEKALELDPENAKTRFEVGMFHAYRNEWAAAIPHFERTRQLSQEGPKLTNAARYRSALIMLERGYTQFADADKAAAARAELAARFPAVSR
ncbi:MAG: tetratricopeptide repeat protein [Nitrospinae bacterium]|nr:tetratricopeptide repeat protein [Nitrospinota bacterium]